MTNGEPENMDEGGNEYYDVQDDDGGSVTDSIGYAGNKYLQDPSLTKEQLSQKIILLNFEHRFLRCEIFKDAKWQPKIAHIKNEETGVMEEMRLRPKANEIGIPTLVGILESGISMNTLLSNMNEYESRMYIGEFLTGLLDAIYLNYDVYGIIPQDAYSIYSYIENIIKPASIRGREGFTARFISRIFGERTALGQKQKYGGVNL